MAANINTDCKISSITEIIIFLYQNIRKTSRQIGNLIIFLRWNSKLIASDTRNELRIKWSDSFSIPIPNINISVRL